ncbi:MAG: DUF4105 domain-containing protein, partial [Gammaproteobacteria bacterium]|nr:DUF4105 domain-containing protein [Gammaproteobacteria bacterium]
MTLTRSNTLIDKSRVHFLRARRLFLGFVMLVCSQVALTNEEFEVPEIAANGAQAWLVTFGPGEIYWERFGHNAIWLREPAAGLDHTFSFGYFDFDQENFIQHFIRGRMLYFSVAQPASREFEFYRGDNRSVRIQKLNLTSSQYQQLRNYLLNEIRPENRNYRYDYYLNNCSTRIRDALDLALDGELSANTRVVPANLNFRDHTRRLTQMEFWYYLGLELGLGYPADREVSRWDEMFIPMVLADEVAAFSLPTGTAEKRAVVVDELMFSGTLPTPISSPTSIWYRYLLLGLLVTGLAWLSGKFMPPVWLAGLCQAWVLICTTNGLILAAMWLFTDHEVTRFNANLLLFNP